MSDDLNRPIILQSFYNDLSVANQEKNHFILLMPYSLPSIDLINKDFNPNRKSEGKSASDIYKCM